MSLRARLAQALFALLAASVSVEAQALTELRIGNGGEPETLDPQRASGVSTGNVVRDLYEGLTAIAPSGEAIPAAAERWSVDAGGLSWTFTLREALRWSNGEPLTAEDFVRGLRRTVDPATGSGFAGMLAILVNARAIVGGRLPAAQLGVEAVDARTLRIRLAAPAPYLPGLLSHPSTFPIHGPSLEKYGRDFARPGRLVSNGAYRLAEWTVQARVVLERNPAYWNDARTGIDRVVYYPTEDLNSELKRYRAGELDISSAIPTAQAPWIRAKLGAELHVARYLGSYFYGYNLTRPPFKDQPLLRQALSMAVDRELIADKLLHGLALPAYGWVPPGVAGYTPQKPAWSEWPRARRLAEAQRLYAAAGYSAAHPLQVEIRYNTQDDNKRIAVVVAAMWKQALGVEVSLVNEEWKVFLQNRRLRQLTQAFRSSWIGDYDDASAFAEILRSTHGRNDSGYVSPAYDALLDTAAQEPDAARRRAALEAAERLVLADAPILPIYYYASKHLVKPRVEGWQDNILDYHYSKDLRLAAP
ncbi:MAG: ABC transporter substrate-binding protein [Nevskia sp.]